MAVGFPDRAGIVPVVVAVPTAALAVTVAVTEMRRPPRRAPRARSEPLHNPYLWLAIFTALLYLVGEAASLAIFGAALARFRGGQSWRVIVPVVAVTTVAFFIVTEVALGESLYRGVFLEALS